GVAYDRANRVVERARSARSDDVLDEVWDALGGINLALDEAMSAYAEQGMSSRLQGRPTAPPTPHRGTGAGSSRRRPVRATSTLGRRDHAVEPIQLERAPQIDIVREPEREEPPRLVEPDLLTNVERGNSPPLPDGAGDGGGSL